MAELWPKRRTLLAAGSGMGTAEQLIEETYCRVIWNQLTGYQTTGMAEVTEAQ